MKPSRIITLAVSLLLAAWSWRALDASAQQPEPKKVAALVACWFPRSHPDVIISRILKTYTLDGKGELSKLKLVSVYRDQPTDKDISAKLASEYGFRISETISDALTLGTGKLAVDGVILSTEWANYPLSPTGQMMYPHRQMFEEIVKVFKQSNRVVPVFIDKHLSDNWQDSKWIYDTAREMKIPLMAGSSIPVTWRRPPADVNAKQKLKEIVGISYHTLDCYGFHGLEMVQCLAEKRLGGETGIASIQCLTNQAVWEASGKVYDPALLQAALSRLTNPIQDLQTLKEKVKEPVLFVMDYQDGLRVNLFTLNYAVGQWAAAWKYENGEADSTLFWTHDDGAFMHFAAQMKGIEQMILTGVPQWPAERTLLTSGALSAALVSKKDDGKPVKTSELILRYESKWQWQQPPEPAGKP